MGTPPAPSPARAGEETDGRHARRAANRAAVVDALLELYRDGVPDPSTNEIAERAGISPRSLFRYFDDTDDLARAAIEHEYARARPLLPARTEPSDDTAVKIERFVEARWRLWQEIEASARASRRRAANNTMIANHLRSARRFLRGQIRELFAPELARMDAAEAAAALACADVLCSFESYELLRHDQRLSQARAASTLRAALARLLSPTGTAD